MHSILNRRISGFTTRRPQPAALRRRVASPSKPRARRNAALAMGSALLVGLTAVPSAQAESYCNANTMREDASSTWSPYQTPDNATVAYAVKSVIKQFRDGDRYEWGACGSIRYSDGKQRFDCSGLMWFGYHNAGRDFTRRSAHELYWSGAAYPNHENGRRVGMWERKPGDLLFWDTNRDGVIEHVGMYLGRNQTPGMNGKEEIAEALSPTAGIRISGFADRQYGIMPNVVRVIG